MSDDEKMKQIEALKPGVADAIEAMDAMDTAIRENGLSIKDLMDGLALAVVGPRQVDHGHDRSLMTMSMMTIALEQDKTRSR